MSLKEYLLNNKKENVYAFYRKINGEAKPYEKMTRNDIYHNIISLYKEDPEIILRLCNMEEIQILKKLLEGNIKKRENGYIDYLLFQNLGHNYLVLEEEGEYYIPDDLVNYVKMAMNLFDEQSYSIEDVIDSALVGISRIYNTILVDDVIQILQEHAIYYDKKSFQDYIKTCSKLKDKVEVIRFKKQDYFVSKEFPFYKDVLKLRKNFKMATYSLEELISFGKYKLNLFQEKTFNFLNFLELHLPAGSIDLFVNDLLFYCGFDLHNEGMLLQICDNVVDLYQETTSVISSFPVWIYYGNCLNNLKENIILPDKNEPCICGSGKKFKNCCEKLFKKFR